MVGLERRSTALIEVVWKLWKVCDWHELYRVTLHRRLVLRVGRSSYVYGCVVSANGLVRSPILKIVGTEKVWGRPSSSEVLSSPSVTVHDEWSMTRYGKEVARPSVTKHFEAVAKRGKASMHCSAASSRCASLMIGVVKGLCRVPLLEGLNLLLIVVLARSRRH
jgi:hypothetical protein